MKPIEEMTRLELREAVAVEVMGVKAYRAQREVEYLEGDEQDVVFNPCAAGDLLATGPYTLAHFYESSIEAAFQVVETLSTKGYDTCLSNGNGPTFAWDCEMTPKGRDTRKPCVLGQANDPALAIARAALKAVRAK